MSETRRDGEDLSELQTDRRDRTDEQPVTPGAAPDITAVQTGIKLEIPAMFVLSGYNHDGSGSC